MIRENNPPTVDDVPRISVAERNTLRRTLDKARADIAAGNFDVVTPATLRREFASVFGRGRGKAVKKVGG